MGLRISVSGYEAIEFVSFDVEGFTTIKGKSNVGKSSIVRAIYSALFNISNSGTVNWNSKEARVRVQFLPPHRPLDVEWVKDHNGITMMVNGKPYQKLSRAQPPEILSYGFKDYEGVAPNFHHLGDPFFLIRNSNSVVGAIMQEILQFAKVHDALTTCGTDGKKTRSLLDTRKGDLQVLEEEYKIWGNLGDYERKISALISLLEKKEQAENDVQDIQALEDEYLVCEEKMVEQQAIYVYLLRVVDYYSSVEWLSELQDFSSHSALVDGGLTLLPRIMAGLGDMDKLESAATDRLFLESLQVSLAEFSRYVIKAEEGLEQVQRGISMVEDVEQFSASIILYQSFMQDLVFYGKMEQDISGVLSETEGAIKSVDKISEFSALHQEIEAETQVLVQMEKGLSPVEVELEQIGHLLKDVKICPLCNSDLKEGMVV